jgi:hypothetical protein
MSLLNFKADIKAPHVEADIKANYIEANNIVVRPTEGLAYELTADESAYECIGLGTATETDIVIPSYHKGLPVIGLGNGCFLDKTGITGVVISDGIQTIGEKAFQGCSSLVNVIIGNNVTLIDKYAFQNCTKLKKVIIGSNVKNIEKNAFCATALTEVLLPKGVEKIGQTAFSNCNKLKDIVIPNSVTTIGFMAINSISKPTIWYEEGFDATQLDGMSLVYGAARETSKFYTSDQNNVIADYTNKAIYSLEANKAEHATNAENAVTANEAATADKAKQADGDLKALLNTIISYLPHSSETTKHFDFTKDLNSVITEQDRGILETFAEDFAIGEFYGNYDSDNNGEASAFDSKDEFLDFIDDFADDGLYRGTITKNMLSLLPTLEFGETIEVVNLKSISVKQDSGKTIYQYTFDETTTNLEINYYTNTVVSDGEGNYDLMPDVSVKVDIGYKRYIASL